MGATEKQFNVDDDVRPATNMQSKWRKLYQIVAAKGVVATVGDPETRESPTAQLARVAFSSPRLRDEIALEPFVPFDGPFRSVSSSSLPNLLGERPLDQPTLPTSTSVHIPTPTPRPLDFLDQPRAQGKLGAKINRDPDYAYILVSRTDMAAEYSDARHDEIRRRQGRRARCPPRGVHLNH